MKSQWFKVYLFLCLLPTVFLNAQEETIPVWDNQLFIGNKVTWGNDKWKYSGELQSRFKENLQALDNWYVEGTATYFMSKHWETVPDFRLIVKPNVVEYRPGIGILRKDLIGRSEVPKHQFVQQLKYQTDISTLTVKHGLRYILFYNNVINEKLIATAVGGVFYSWKDNFTGLEYVRAGGGLAYIADKRHALNFLYFAGAANAGDSWVYQGNLVLQLVININREYKYIPAKYINF